MYEGKFKPNRPGAKGPISPLRQFRWTDLVAKLSATRELRDELDRVDGGFNAFADVRREETPESKSVVNQADLTAGKHSRLRLGNAAGGAAQGHREKE